MSGVQRWLAGFAAGLYRWSWRLAIALLVLLALYASLGRYYIQYLDDYSDSIEAYILREAGLKLELEGLEGSWSGLAPNIAADRIRLSFVETVATGAGLAESAEPDQGVADKASDNRLALELVDVNSLLGVVTGLLDRRAVDIASLDVERAELHFYQGEDGRWRFAGRPLAGEQTSLDLVSLILGIRDATAREVELFLHHADGSLAKVWARKLRLRGDPGFRRLHAKLGIEESRPTELLLELEGDPRQQNFALDAYLRLEDSAFDTLSPLLGRYSSLAQGRGSGELWLSMRGRNNARWQGRLAVPHFNVGALWDNEARVNDIELQFQGRLTDQVAQMWAPRLELQWHGQPIDWSGIQARAPLSGTPAIEIAVPRLDLGRLRERFLDSGLLSEKLHAVIAELAPRGVLHNAVATLPFGEEGEFRLVSELKGVALDSWRGAPSVEGLDGYLDTGARGGELSIDAEKIDLGLPKVYAEPLRISSVGARLTWALREDELRIRSGLIRARDQDSPLRAHLSLELPLSAQSNRSPKMWLLAGISDAQVEQRHQYLPAVLGEGLRGWLERSLKDGRVPQAAFLYAGSLKKEGQKAIQLRADAENVSLDYHPDWPAVHGASARLLVDGGRVSVEGDSATIYDDVALRDIHVDVGESPQGLILHVDGRAEADVGSALRLVRESAIRQQVGGAFDDWSGEGRVEAAIELGIPLEPGTAPEIRVHSSIAARSLRLGGMDLALEDVSGPLVFDSRQGLNGRNIQATVLGRPVEVNVLQVPGKPILVNAQGRVAVDAVRRWLDQPVLGFATGEANYNIDISVGGSRSHLKASSDLFGVAIDLPGALAKPAQESRLLELDIPLGEKPWRLDLNVDQLGRLLLSFSEVGFVGGSFALRDQSIPPPPEGQFMVVGRLQQADLSAWQAVLARYEAMRGLENKATPGVDKSSAKQGGVEKAATLPLIIEDFHVVELRALGQTWRDVDIEAHNGADGRGPWQVTLDSPRISGEMRLPEQAPIELTLQRLQLPELFTSQDSTAKQNAELTSSAMAVVDPRTLPDVDFSVQQLVLGNQPLGDIAFNLRSDEQGLTLEGVRGNLRGLITGTAAAPMTLQWLRGEAGDETRLKGRLSVADIGEVLSNWRFERLMESRSGYIDLDLHWPAAPDAVAARLLSGDMTMHFEKGRFLRGSDAAAGTLRMVGILNFANIIRRLQFDFRDVFKKGIHYDAIDGRMRFKQGVMHTLKAIEIEGPSSAFRIGGSLDFNTDQTDMDLIATLPVTSNLPWVAALIGGLPAAAGAYIASKVFEEQVDKVSSLAYHVSGPWQEPELEFKRLFGDKVSIEAPAETAPRMPSKGGKGK